MFFRIEMILSTKQVFWLIYLFTVGLIKLRVGKAFVSLRCFFIQMISRFWLKIDTILSLIKTRYKWSRFISGLCIVLSRFLFLLFYCLYPLMDKFYFGRSIWVYKISLNSLYHLRSVMSFLDLPFFSFPSIIYFLNRLYWFT